MVFKSSIGVICACLTSISFNLSAAVVSTDWLVAGDNLITHDTVSGLDWLDLTQTNDLSFDFVSGQLATGGQFAGWRYATNTEVVALWNNFGINLNSGHPTSISGIDSGVGQAVAFIGNIVNEFTPTIFPHGALGITSDQPSSTRHSWVVAYTRIDSTYYHDERYSLSDDVIRLHTGSYLELPQKVNS